MNNAEQQSKYERIFLIFLIPLFVFLVVLIIFLFQRNDSIDYENSVKYIQNIEIPGYTMDKEFKNDIYDYNLEVDMDEIYLTCDTTEELDGCNEKIDLNGKQEYDHKIVIKDENEKETVYTIHITKKEVNNDNIRISSISGIPLEWTSKEVTIIIGVSTKEDKENIEYSFDDGNTFQKDNKIVVKNNQTLNVVVKDGKTSAKKSIIINKIDTKEPNAQISISQKSSNKIILSALATDNESGISGYSWNGSEFNTTSKKEITQAGTYTLEVKDAAGNISKKAEITIKSTDFIKEESKIEKTFTAILSSNGAGIAKSKVSCTTSSDSCEVTLPKIIREDYEIIGYSTSSNAKMGMYKSGATIQLNSDISLYAITSKTLKATFNKNGATSITSTSSSCTLYNTDKTCIITTPTITRSGFTVVGFNTNKDASAGSVKTGTTIKINKSATYYAITYKPITITFNSNGATSLSKTSVSCNIYNSSTSCEITSPTITRDGFTIVGFNTDKNAQKSSLNVNTKKTVSANGTYYAITKKKYIATFNKNGATTIAGLSDITELTSSCSIYNTQTSCNTSTPTITRSGFTVVGWNKYKSANENTSGTVTAGSSVSISKDVTYYAITYKNLIVKYARNGATTVGKSEDSCNIYNTATSCSITLPTITRSGFTVVGWNTDKTATTANHKVGTSINISKDIDYYAITYKKITAFFYRNTATTINGVKDEYVTDSCNIYNTSKSCKISKTPTITRSDGGVLGWHANSKSESAIENSLNELTLNYSTEDDYAQSFYAITYKNLTVSFVSDSTIVKTCKLYGSNTGCNVTVPEYSIKGQFDILWSLEKNISLVNGYKSSTVNKINPQVVISNQTITVSSNKTYYTNNNHPWLFSGTLEDEKEGAEALYSKYKYYRPRTVSIKTTETVGNVKFEYESGISDETINTHYNALSTAYSQIPKLFNKSTKAFVFTAKTYSSNSKAYGLTHHFGNYKNIDGTMYYNRAFIDVYDDDGVISINSTLHELAHVYDKTFEKTGDAISSKDLFEKFYNEIFYYIADAYRDDAYRDGTSTTKDSSKRLEMFAATVTNYYWHVLGNDTSKSYYGFNNINLSDVDKEKIRTATENYIIQCCNRLE